MNTKSNMIIANGKIITADIASIFYNHETYKYDVTFKTGQTYHYNYDSINWLNNPESLPISMYKIYHNNREFFNVSEIYLFKSNWSEYYLICFSNGKEKAYCGSELKVVKSCFINKNSKNVFDYLKDLAENISLKNEEGERLLSFNYNKIDFIGEDTVLADYLNPAACVLSRNKCSGLIFPFGCNFSQYNAVKLALENKISIIEGPPGTGKTQTILNIIANLVVRNKTIQVVSCNNSAIENILEKLEKYDLNFIAALLGRKENKEKFIIEQKKEYPDLNTWKQINVNQTEMQLNDYSAKLLSIYKQREELAKLNSELNAIKLEYRHFKEYREFKDDVVKKIKIRQTVDSNRVLKILRECQASFEKYNKLKLLKKIKLYFMFGKNLAKNKEQDVLIAYLQTIYYYIRTKEVENKIEHIKCELKDINANQLEEKFKRLSMQYFKSVLRKKYDCKKERKVFSSEDLYRNTNEFLEEYPVILSTTFSALSSLNKNVIYDYVIMDESSQIDVATGALALSSAKNVVIVGDSKQLPNVISKAELSLTNKIFEEYKINKCYNYASYSFLNSVSSIFPNVPKTLLREHYRCHPKIINFCNQKFYNNELIIMTEDNGEDGVMNVVLCNKGNYEREHINYRQIENININILPKHNCLNEEIGIIAPYNNQIEELKKVITNDEIEIATIHKFQGREKDVIILSTVDDKPTEFSDDANLINVAVSRAKKQFYLVAPDEEQIQDSNLRDLVSYIRYNSFIVTKSKIFSIFDYLYSQYTNERLLYLKNHKRVSEFDSENLMYALIVNVLKELDRNELNVICHQQLNMLIKDFSLLNEEERKYALNPATHLDFLIYNKISKKPVLAIEVDGYWYHKIGTRQAERDKMKNKILDLYQIPYIRFKTTGSGEKDILKSKLEKLTKVN